MKNIGNGHYFGIDMDFVPRKAEWIAGSVHFFVMLQCRESYALINGRSFTELLVAVGGVHPHFFRLIIRK
ncbi:hypothetical protein D3C73_1615960 [compost metagenome]